MIIDVTIIDVPICRCGDGPAYVLLCFYHRFHAGGLDDYSKELNTKTALFYADRKWFATTFYQRMHVSSLIL